MALQHNIEFTKEGFTGTLSAENVYSKVSSLSGDKSSIFFVLQTFAEKDGVQLRENSYSFSPNLNGNNFIAQAYEHLKTLPEFSGATDV